MTRNFLFVFNMFQKKTLASFISAINILMYIFVFFRMFESNQIVTHLFFNILLHSKQSNIKSLKVQSLFISIHICLSQTESAYTINIIAIILT